MPRFETKVVLARSTYDTDRSVIVQRTLVENTKKGWEPWWLSEGGGGTRVYFKRRKRWWRR